MSNQGYRYNSFYIITLSFIAAAGGYLFGFDFAVISGALPFLKNQFNLDVYWEGFATGTLALGAMLGCILAGKIADKKGRRPGLLIAAAVFSVSSLMMAGAPGRNLFIIARFAAGIGVGMASILSPMYIAEVAPARHRGRMVAVYQLTMVLGILITTVVNYSLRNTGDNAWRWMFGLGIVPSLLFFIGVLFLPESPRWLAQTNNYARASKILEKIGGKDFSDETLAEIRKPSQTNTSSGFGAVLEKNIFPAVLLGTGLAVFQQFCGINVVFNYATVIFESIGASTENQLLQSVLIGGVNLLFTLLAMLLVDKTGRKPLMLFGAGGLAVLYFIISQMLAVKSPLVSWFLLSAIGTYALTLAPVTWILISEIFPNKVRGAATSIAVVSLWAAYFILTFTFPVLFDHFRDKTFYVYAGICVLGFLFILKKVKETKGKTLEELEKVFSPH